MSTQPKAPGEPPPSLSDFLALIGFIIVMSAFAVMLLSVLYQAEVDIADAAARWWRG